MSGNRSTRSEIWAKVVLIRNGTWPDVMFLLDVLVVRLNEINCTEADGNVLPLKTANVIIDFFSMAQERSIHSFNALGHKRVAIRWQAHFEERPA